ncbi:hypothetical protein A2706_00100 [Candidatus Peribacteria bacterium RIFCSPHIGHO2_01_FULL_51_35]|nr:MAG: hypothetical protein A2706_00100 [Candidatus Peribacteria bacterium RIFCSPHIGHO2_01_FULL_51_35]
MLLSRIRLQHVAIAIVLLCIAIFGLHLGNDFVLLDDGILIFRNPFIAQLTPWSLKMIFTTYDPELYVPLTLFTYQIEHLLFGFKPFFFHLDNLLLHIANALLVLTITYKISRKNLALAAFVAILFAIHPLHTEAVLWASARKDTLSALFFLLSMDAFLRYRSRENKKWYIGSIVFFLLALLSKVSVIMLPFIFLMLDVRDKRPLKKSLLEQIPYFVLAMIFGIVAILGKTKNIAGSDPLTTLLLAMKSTVFYIAKLFVPLQLSVIYPQTDPVSLMAPEFIAIILGCIALAIIFFVSLRYAKDVAFGLAFFGLMLIPNYSNFLKNNFFYFASDRYAYLASVGFFLAIGAVLVPFVQKKSTIAASAFLTVIVIFSGLTFVHGKTWKNSEALYRNVLDNYPRSGVALNNLGDVLMKQDDAAAAKEYFEQALEVSPGLLQAHLNLGNVYRAENALDKAVEEYRMFIRIAEQKDVMGPEDMAGYYFLGETLESMGKHQESIRQFEIATEKGPEFAETFFNLGLQYQKRDRTNEAVKIFEQAVRVDPLYARAHYHLAGVYGETGNIAGAIRELEIVLRLDPANAAARAHLQNLKQIRR